MQLDNHHYYLIIKEFQHSSKKSYTHSYKVISYSSCSKAVSNYLYIYLHGFVKGRKFISVKSCRIYPNNFPYLCFCNWTQHHALCISFLCISVGNEQLKKNKNVLSHSYEIYKSMLKVIIPLRFWVGLFFLL